MNGYFKEVIITKQGLAILNEIIGKKGRIEFTKIALGKGKEENSIIELENVVDKVIEIPVKISLENSNTYKLIGILDNDSISEAFMLSEMGVYAKDEDGKEILFSYTYSDYGEYIPTSSEVKFVREFSFDTTISQTLDIEIIVDNSNIYVTQEDLRDLDNKFTSEMEDLKQGTFQKIKFFPELNTYEKYPMGISVIYIGVPSFEQMPSDFPNYVGQLVTHNYEELRCYQEYRVSSTNLNIIYRRNRHVTPLEEKMWSPWRKISMSEEVTLWSGSVSDNSGTIVLSDKISNYKSLKFTIDNAGSREVQEHQINTYFKITGTNLPDNASSMSNVTINELGLECKNRDENLLIKWNNAFTMYLDGSKSRENLDAGVAITKIVGVI